MTKVNHDKILVADIFIIFATVLIWRGAWVLCDDTETYFHSEGLMFWRGIFSIIFGIVLLWIILKLNWEKGFLTVH